MIRKVLVLSFIAAIMAVVVASAATLGVGGGVIQSGMDNDLRCDTDGVKVLGWGYESDTNLVSFVRIGDICVNCEGASMAVMVYDNGANLIQKCWINTLTASEVDPGQVKCSFATPQPAQNIGSIRVTIEGGE